MPWHRAAYGPSPPVSRGGAFSCTEDRSAGLVAEVAAEDPHFSHAVGKFIALVHQPHSLDQSRHERLRLVTGYAACELGVAELSAQGGLLSRSDFA